MATTVVTPAAPVEYAGGTPESQKCLDFLAQNFPKEFKKVRFGTKEAGQAWQKHLESIGGPPYDSMAKAAT